MVNFEGEPCINGQNILFTRKMGDCQTSLKPCHSDITDRQITLPKLATVYLIMYADNLYKLCREKIVQHFCDMSAISVSAV